MQAFARFLQAVERGFDRLRPVRKGPVVVDPYLGYATPDELVLRGRILTTLRRTDPDPRGAWWTNLRQMVSLFLTREVGGITVTAQGRSAVSDEEGYFTLHLPRGDASGWAEIEVSVERGEPALLEALVPPADAPFAVISDIDDTVMHTGAYSLLRNLWTSFTGNALTREVFPDAIEILTRFRRQGAPIYYVSSSPWNLHHFLTRIFSHHGVPRGPMFLRDLGLSRAKLLGSSHGTHKGACVDILMAALPEVPFILMGDTGQHDPQVYLAAAQRHPGRVARVILREPGPGADADDLRAIEALRQRGIEVVTDRDFRAALS